MADKFDPYREALVIETETIWPEGYEAIPPSTRSQIEAQLHETPENANHLEYIRVHTGFCRKITVTEDDLR